ncbi:hypothetical protein ASE03_32290 [Kitasatospora sp. Root187]|nr:hypothetical protein ASC99_25795 [Kitasatospora sp. Root107]KRB65577.1 hypothetical protein ASE03_32290 [Kitasatospora sp. Root187]
MLLAASAAVADSARFHYANASTTSSGALKVNFKETGLGTTVSTETVTLTVTNASADYQCWNHGGKHPQAGNKETVSTQIVDPNTFPVRNGQVTAAITVGPAGPGDFTCPGGQTLYLMSATYSGISLSGQAGTIAATPDPVSTGPIMIKVSGR